MTHLHHLHAHLVAKQAVDEVDLMSRLSWFGGDPEIIVANSCLQLLFKCQVLEIQALYITHLSRCKI